LFARLWFEGKLIRHRLKTKTLSVAKRRLSDFEKDERAKAEQGCLLAKGKMLFKDALAACRENGFRPIVPRNQKDARALKPAALACYRHVLTWFVSWPSVDSARAKRRSSLGVTVTLSTGKSPCAAIPKPD